MDLKHLKQSLTGGACPKLLRDLEPVTALVTSIRDPNIL